MHKHSRRKEIVLPVRVAEQTARLLKKAAASEPLTTRLRCKLSQAATELELRVGIAGDGQVSIPQKLLLAVLRGMTFLVHFHKEILEMANTLMGIKDK